MSRSVRAAAAIGAAAFCVSHAACSNSGGGAIASVYNQTISRADFDKKLESTPTGKQVLAQMIQQDLIDQYAQNNHITVSQADIDKQENDIKSKYGPGQFEQVLKNQGLTEQDVQNIVKERLVLNKAVAPQVHVSDSDVKAYFDKNHALFDKPAQVRARHILVADPKTAQTVLAKLKAGGSWDALAKQYSTDPSTKDKGGELGWFGRGQMVPQFQDAAFAAKVGQIVGPVKSPFGYHIIQVEEKRPATKATLAAVQGQIRDQLTQQQESAQVPTFLNQLRSTASIQINDDRYKDLFPPLPSASAGASAAPAAGASPAPAASSAAAPSPAPSGK
jgi:foldase protein PrsA